MSNYISNQNRIKLCTDLGLISDKGMLIEELDQFDKAFQEMEELYSFQIDQVIAQFSNDGERFSIDMATRPRKQAQIKGKYLQPRKSRRY